MTRKANGHPTGICQVCGRSDVRVIDTNPNFDPSDQPVRGGALERYRVARHKFRKGDRTYCTGRNLAPVAVSDGDDHQTHATWGPPEGWGL